LAVGGCTLLITAGGELQVDAQGILLALDASASYAGCTIVIKELLATHAPAAVTAVLFCGGAL
jgi:drug/metabolite transporter (DMT)-like permease